MLVDVVLLSCGVAGAVAGGRVVTAPCDASDPAQQWTFNPSSGQLRTTFGNGACAVVGTPGTDTQIVLAPCTGSDWRLQAPVHPVAAGSTWLVSTHSPQGSPYCMEDPGKTNPTAGTLDVYCCSGESSDCSSTYPTALPWQQWSLAAGAMAGHNSSSTALPSAGAGLIKNLGGGNACLSAAGPPPPPPPPPPLLAAPVWPLPQSLACTAGTATAGTPMLSSKVSVQLTGPGAGSTVATQAAARYQAILQGAGVPTGAVSTVSIAVQTDAELLSRETNYSYSLQYAGTTSGGVVSGSAASPYGVGYALETFLQLAEASNQAECGGGFAVVDAPDFPHRGLMIDTGRRFYPVPLVESLLEGMAMMKMNVMHMFLSELCFRVESKLYPALHSFNCTTGGLVNNGWYSQDDIQNLVAFARARGIRLIPEFDMPGHSGGFCNGLAAAGIVCCGHGGMGVPQIQDDPAGKSAALVSQILQEMSTLFPDTVMHIGGDETGATPPCTLEDTKSFEVKMIAFVSQLGKEVMGWEEVLFKTGAAANDTNVIIDSWASSSWQQAAGLGHRAVASNSGTLYLDIHSHLAPSFWQDIKGAGGGDNKTQLAKLLGGEVSMWQDFYVPGARTKSEGSASCLFSSKRDADFETSTSSTVWPRTAIGGGSFWNYNGGLSSGSSVFDAVISTINSRLSSRGITTCSCATATDIGCVQNSYCGKIWCPDGGK